MPIYPFERMVFPKRVASPFMSKSAKGAAPVKGPGGIDDGAESVSGEKGEGSGAGSGAVASARKRSKRAAAVAAAAATSSAAAANDVGTSAKGVHTPAMGTSNTAYTPHQVSHTPQIVQAPHRVQGSTSSKDRSVVGAIGGLATVGNNASIEKLPPETGG